MLVKREFIDREYLSWLKGFYPRCLFCDEILNVDLHHMHNLCKSTSDLYIVPLCNNFSINNHHQNIGHSNFWLKLEAMLDIDNAKEIMKITNHTIYETFKSHQVYKDKKRPYKEAREPLKKFDGDFRAVLLEVAKKYKNA